jgi:hypothetical protein
MRNYNAVKINETLGVVIFKEANLDRLQLIKYSKKQIKEFCIEDLINNKGQGTDRLAKLVKEILFPKETV